MKKIAVYGAGDFGVEVAYLIREISAAGVCERECVGFFDDSVPAGTRIDGLDLRVLGGIDTLNAFPEDLEIAMAIATPRVVKSIVGKITNPRISFPNIIAPDVRFVDRARVRFGRGNVIGARSMISVGSVFGDFNLCVFDNIFGHGSRIGDFNVFFTSTRISGNVSVGDRNSFGVNFSALQKLKIGNGNVLGASSLLTHNISDNATYIGVPAQKLLF